MQTESALHGVAELSGEVNNVGQYSKLYVCLSKGDIQVKSMLLHGEVLSNRACQVLQG